MTARFLGRSDMTKLARQQARLGWTWSMTGSGHLRWVHPEVPGPVFTSATPRVHEGNKERQKMNTALKRAREAAGA